ncbi:MAG TPA: hypothetical protein VIQ02_11815 [Jiangellaceae bacterium]|jgi:hypothetical protein
MASRSWTGWIIFAAMLMIIIGMLDFFQGLIAIIRDDYYVMTGEQLIVFDLTAWGWIMLIWGVLLMFAGSALFAGRSWARWFTIIVGSLNFIIQLGFVGSSQYTLWALTGLALNVFVLYALMVRWEKVEETTI